MAGSLCLQVPGFGALLPGALPPSTGGLTRRCRCRRPPRSSRSRRACPLSRYVRCQNARSWGVHAAVAWREAHTELEGLPCASCQLAQPARSGGGRLSQALVRQPLAFRILDDVADRPAPPGALDAFQERHRQLASVASVGRYAQRSPRISLLTGESRPLTRSKN
jgi:hypothetical protein